MKTKITNVQLFDGTGSDLTKTTILFDEKTIIGIGDKVKEEEADLVIDGDGLTCVPGLMDCHVHLTMNGSADPFGESLGKTEADDAYKAYRNAQNQIESGVVTVRNVGSKANVDIALRKAIESGVVKGPRILASGEPIVMTGGHGHTMAIEADGVDEVRKAARTQLKKGADLLKLMATGGVMTPGVDPNSPQLGEDELSCACTEASNAGKTTAAHAQGVEGIKNAIRAGITTVEHGIYLDEEAIDMMLERGTYLVPTLAAPFNIVERGLDEGIPEHAVQKAERVMGDHVKSFYKAYERGVKIAAGTDAGTPFNRHGDFVTELELMVKNGMKHEDVLQSATKVAAEAMKIDSKTGTVEEGKLADLLLVEGNPLEDISALRKVVKVFKEGECYVSKDVKEQSVVSK
ncbi:metal-dependent hydrolase family protein [Pseudalkalibacillus caeni]|uniref:Amidohydrolase family protein n=1 Tax=Exobacillus caeni TaxID=2574798 RepID=A0A5R9F1E7_9BACL|nr:amidohydrolase family protein [Pseudalkalibacillus caeni]TLS36489.1 amidohydrolase family protein [Pseudalkalibacillus caeni]